MKSHFVFEGIVCDEPAQLKNDKTHVVQGHSCRLGGIGVAVSFYVPATDVPEPKKGDVIRVTGDIVENKNTGWGKPKVRQAELVKSAKKQEAATAA